MQWNSIINTAEKNVYWNELHVVRDKKSKIKAPGTEKNCFRNITRPEA
jgi:hypothetical protein